MDVIIENFMKFDIPGEIISSLLVMLIICILSFVIYFKFRKADPYEEKPSKFVVVVTTGVNMVRNLTVDLMGKKWEGFAGYSMCIFIYVFIAFTFSLCGLPGPMTCLAVPFSLGLCTFVLIHVTAMKANKLGYFKRYIDPMPMFLPINLLSMWSPLLSLSLRLFGNALSGFVLMTLVYNAMGGLSSMIFSFIESEFNSIFLAPFVTPFLHAYFDVFSGAIQTLVFCMLTMIFVSQEDPDETEEELLTLQRN